MRMIKINDVELHVQIDGDASAGSTLVFANSLGTDLRLWDKIIPALAQDRRIIRFDKRGHGLSVCPPGPYQMDDLVNDAEALLDTLGVTACDFVGLSIGGMIGQGLAAKRPDLISRLVLSNSAAKMGDAMMWQTRMAAVESGGIEAIADGVMERWFSPQFRTFIEMQAWRAMLARTPAEGYLGCCAAIAAADLAPSTKQLTLPTLGIAGRHDGASPPEVVKATIDLIAGAQFAVIEEAGHLPVVEQPEEYLAILTRFLGRV